MVNFMYIFEISLVEFIRNISVSKKHTLMDIFVDIFYPLPLYGHIQNKATVLKWPFG